MTTAEGGQGPLDRFIESSAFPIDEINEFSAAEKRGGGRPDFWEMVFWWTRKPLIGARAVIAGALLPASCSPYEFKHIVRLWPSGKTPHRESPSVTPRLKEQFAKVRLLDPFAGFGSIPLEAMRLGLGEVVAVELLPTAYIFLKAVLEYPKLFGRQLINDVERWGKWIVDRLREDPDIKELYDEDVAVYIGSWEVKCPHCGNYTPLVANWWLARVSRGSSEEEEGEEEEEVKRGVFKRIAWMEPFKLWNTVGIRVVDLNKELNREEVQARISTRQGLVEVQGKVYSIPKANIDARRETATCLICNNAIKESGRIKEWHVKEALREYNEVLERYLKGEAGLEELLASRARPRILVKVKVINKKLEFEPATEEDNEKLWKALEKLRELWGDPDIPIEELWKYRMGTAGQLSIWTWGYDKFCKLFNPRQLLTLIKLVKLIREAGKGVEKEKLKQSWDEQKARKYAEAIATYLAMILCKHADWNSIVSGWQLSYLIAAHTLAMRGIAMIWNWGEYDPLSNYRGTILAMAESMPKAIEYLVNTVSGSPSLAKIMLDDATVLSKLENIKFNLIVTDPPYRDDVAYSELSDLYYVWLKRALSDVDEAFGVPRLVPRFHRDAFFDELGNEVESQWRAFALREVSENEGRVRYFGVGSNALEHFKSLLTESFKSMAFRLVDNGLLITYYAHTSPDAWEALLEAGWLNSKMRITTAYAIATEAPESVVARGKIRLDMAIVAVWRKGVKGEALVDRVYAEAVEACSNDALKYRKSGFEGVNLFVAVLGKVLSHFTKYERLIGLKASGSPVKELVEKYVYPATAEAIARSYGAVGARLSPTSMFYLLSKVLVGRRPRQARRALDRTTSIILAIGTRSDLKELEKLRVIERDRERYALLEPKWGARGLKEAIEDALNAKGLSPRSPVIATAVDVLHLLEYYAAILPKEEFKKKVDEIRRRAPAFFDEAVDLAKILAQGLASEDPEMALAKQVVEALGIGAPGTLEPFVRR